LFLMIIKLNYHSLLPANDSRTVWPLVAIEQKEVPSIRDGFLVRSIATNGLGYEQLRGLTRTFASTRQAENSAGIFRMSV